MNDELNGAVDALLKKLEEQERTVTETKKMINLLLDMMGKNPQFLDSELQQSKNILKVDMFYGKPLATAAREYLEWKGTACKLGEILEGLLQGGFDFGQKGKFKLRNLSVSLSKNSVVFHKLPNGTIGLLSWYPEAKKKRSKVQNNSEEEESQEEILEENEN